MSLSEPSFARTRVSSTSALVIPVASQVEQRGRPTLPRKSPLLLFTSLNTTSARSSWRHSPKPAAKSMDRTRSEEHTSELQSHHDLVCRLLLEKKKKSKIQAALGLLMTHYI